MPLVSFTSLEVAITNDNSGNIQLDDPVFAFFCYPPTTSGMKEAGEDPEALLDTYIYSINTCTKNRPKDLHVAVHICRGNYKASPSPVYNFKNITMSS